jgi:hypothetical protein
MNTVVSIDYRIFKFVISFDYGEYNESKDCREIIQYSHYCSDSKTTEYICNICMIQYASVVLIYNKFIAY